MMRRWQLVQSGFTAHLSIRKALRKTSSARLPNRALDTARCKEFAFSPSEENTLKGRSVWEAMEKESQP